MSWAQPMSGAQPMSEASALAEASALGTKFIDDLVCGEFQYDGEQVIVTNSPHTG